MTQNQIVLTPKQEQTIASMLSTNKVVLVTSRDSEILGKLTSALLSCATKDARKLVRQMRKSERNIIPGAAAIITNAASAFNELCRRDVDCVAFDAIDMCAGDVDETVKLIKRIAGLRGFVMVSMIADSPQDSIAALIGCGLEESAIAGSVTVTKDKTTGEDTVAVVNCLEKVAA